MKRKNRRILIVTIILFITISLIINIKKGNFSERDLMEFQDNSNLDSNEKIMVLDTVSLEIYKNVCFSDSLKMVLKNIYGGETYLKFLSLIANNNIKQVNAVLQRQLSRKVSFNPILQEENGNTIIYTYQVDTSFVYKKNKIFNSRQTIC